MFTHFVQQQAISKMMKHKQAFDSDLHTATCRTEVTELSLLYCKDRVLKGIRYKSR